MAEAHAHNIVIALYRKCGATIKLQTYLQNCLRNDQMINYLIKVKATDGNAKKMSHREYGVIHQRCDIALSVENEKEVVLWVHLQVIAYVV